MQLKCKKKKKKKDLCSVWRRCCDQICQKWFVKFCAGDFSLGDAPPSGRPVEVDSNQIETLIENNQCYTMWERADILKISKSIKLLVKMKNVCLFYRKKPYGFFFANPLIALIAF